MPQKTDYRPILALTPGDPSGIGPEITVMALTQPEILADCRPLVIGEKRMIERAMAATDLNLEINVVTDPKTGRYQEGWLDLVDLGNINEEIPYGVVKKAGGQAALDFIHKSIDLALDNQVDAVVTGPIHKEAIHLTGCRQAGHTEIFGQRTGAEAVSSMLSVGDFRVIHVTLHVGLVEACRQLSRELILDKIRLAHEAMLDLGIAKPRIAVPGLNPHSSDGGLFGDEEERIIIPALKEARANGYDVDGPVPPDSVFIKLRGRKYDVALALYHDQGHIPTKLLGWNWDEESGRWTAMSGVGVTLGLPIIRTNPDNGTAFDLAGTGQANPQAMVEAVQMAAHLARAKRNV